MGKLQFTVVLEKGENGYIVAHCPTLKGCWSQGKTEEEALSNIKQAIEGWLEAELEKTRGELAPDAKVYQVVV